MAEKLTINKHDRNAAGLKYVYPVMSRRSGGLSIGINFNTNNACNWRCIYCQVPGLTRGTAPELDMHQLENELTILLRDVLNGDFFHQFQIDEKYRKICDVAISGNGEPTSLKQFPEAVELIGSIIAGLDLPDHCKFILITNGSLIGHKHVQRGLTMLKQYGGEIWFKIDRATESGQKFVNNAAISSRQLLANLETAARLCPTWLQTCVFNAPAAMFDQAESSAYIKMLAQIKNTTRLEGVLLYTLARPSLQPEADQLTAVTADELNDLAEQIRQLGMVARVYQ